MMRVLLWKEFREHRSIWLAVAAISALALIVLVQLIDPPGLIPPQSEKAEIIPGVAVMMAVIYGLTCGAMMLAGECEGGTQGFLDALTGRRTRLWWSKLLIGLIVSLAFALLLAVLVFVIELAAGIKAAGGSWYSELIWFAVIPGFALLAYTWGMLGSALGRSILTAVLWGFGAYIVLGSLGSAIVFLAWDAVSTWFKQDHSGIPNVLSISTIAGTALVGLASSGLLYCRSDLNRRHIGKDTSFGRTGIVSLASWGSLFWLTWCQGSRIALTLAMIALVLGLAVPIDEVAYETWVIFTLTAGVACGTCVFAFEQVGSTHRFLGNQRLPPGRVWFVKTGFWFAVGLGAALIAFLAFELHLSLAGKEVQKSWRHMETDFRPLWDLIGGMRFGVLWLMTGFGVGQFFALLWKKSIVAVGISLPVAAALAGIWIPSLVGGGLHAWQICAIPIILLVATRLSMWTWMGDRLSSFRAAATLTGAGFLALICLVVGINYRQAEIPNVGEPFDVKAFEKSIPGPEQGNAVWPIKQALDLLFVNEKMATAKLGPPKPPPKKPKPPAKIEQPKPDEVAAVLAAGAGDPIGEEEAESAPQSYFDIIQRVLDEGRPIDEDPQLGQWLDEVFRPNEFRGDWLQQLNNAVQLPLAAFVDPKTASLGGDFHWRQFQVEHAAGAAGPILAARALQLLARGDDADALDHLMTALALSRHVRNKTPSYGYMIGVGIEKHAIDVMERWLQQLGPRPELLHKALQELTYHEAATPPYIDSLKTDFLITRNSLNDLGHSYFLFVSNPKSPGLEKPMLSELLRAAWQAPWEKERRERMNNLVFAGWLRGGDGDYSQLLQNDFDVKQKPQSHAWNLLKNWFPPEARRPSSVTREKLSDWLEQSILPEFLFRGSYVGPYLYYRQTKLRGLRLQMALALYQLEEKKPAPNLQALVPRYLPELPLDPFSGQPFYYRVSAGEKIFWLDSTEEINVLAGQGILWSVGLDGRNNGGRNQGSGDRMTDPATWEREGLDLIFLVPQWSPKR
jgi:ABC-type transport system involved in multi-copper enzyme maturation permease subunit